MRVHLGLVMVVAAAMGCGLEEPVETSELTQGMTIKCPDPDDCTLSNGGGVYTEELGFAGLGPNDFMILRFINNSNGTVSIRGRQHDPVTNHWVASTQQVLHAYYAPMGAGTFPVMWVGENGTIPMFKLGTAASNFWVNSNAIVDLRLVIQVDGVAYTLSFWNPMQEPTQSANYLTPLRSIYMRWNPEKSFNWSTSHPYCYRAPVDSSQDTDPVVFQQGIGVNPITAVMSTDDTFTTLSCRHGAPATARAWGYPYRGTTTTTTNMFEAAMHMKRASYCGDETFFTRAGVVIKMSDTASPQVQSSTLDAHDFEASWGVTPSGIRATCVNWYKRRRPQTLFPPPVLAPPSVTPEQYDGHCGDGTVIPDCGVGAFGSLASQLVPTSP